MSTSFCGSALGSSPLLRRRHIHYQYINGDSHCDHVGYSTRRCGPTLGFPLRVPSPGGRAGGGGGEKIDSFVLVGTGDCSPATKCENHCSRTVADRLVKWRFG